MRNAISILDCTLRDGSYAIDCGWTAENTRLICAALQDAGVERIEIGHGVGLNGSNARFGIAAASDREYCEAAAQVLTAARFGAFFIPGIGRYEDLDMAAALGMTFVRIGTNATEVSKARPYLEHAKRLGLEVFYNAMKSYLLRPQDLAKAVRPVTEWGADYVYVVDSAGCMLPDDVREYVLELRAISPCPVGFHGHNNLMLAVANCLSAVSAGATMVDGTLQGIGRSGGNAQMEALVAVFEKRGISSGIDLLKALGAGEALVRPVMQSGGNTSLDIAIGVGGFHSSNLPRIQAVTNQIPIDPKRLIIALGEVDRSDPSEEVIAEIARALLAESERER